MNDWRIHERLCKKQTYKNVPLLVFVAIHITRVQVSEYLISAEYL